MVRKNTKNDSSGFTLIEALVAISILAIAITGPLALAAKGLSYASYAKDEITAFYLANEAIEVVRNIRDTNINSGAVNWLNVPGGTNGDIDLIQKCGGSGGCTFDVWKKPTELKSTFTSNRDVQLCAEKIDNSYLYRFGTNFDWFKDVGGSCESTESSGFSRVLKILQPGNNPDEARVTVTVSWMARNGLERSVVISENIFKLGTI